MPDELAGEEPIVRYTVRELLARIDGKIDTLTTAVALKADKSDLDRIEQRLDGHSTRITALETWRHDKEERAKVHEQRDQREEKGRARWWARWERLLLVAAAVASAVGIVIGVLHA